MDVNVVIPVAEKKVGNKLMASNFSYKQRHAWVCAIEYILGLLNERQLHKYHTNTFEPSRQLFKISPHAFAINVCSVNLLCEERSNLHQQCAM